MEKWYITSTENLNPELRFFDSNNNSLNQKNLCFTRSKNKDLFISKTFLGYYNQNFLVDRIVSKFNQKFSWNQEIFCESKKIL